MSPPKLTPAQFAARQDRWRREEQFSTASTVINCLLAFPFLSMLFPFIIPILATTMSWIDVGLKANRRKILHDEQIALNAEKKTVLLKKGEILDKIDRLTQLRSPKNIISAIPSSEPKMIHGGIKKKKDALVNSPSNISFNTLKRRLLDTPVIITPLHKRQS